MIVQKVQNSQAMFATIVSGAQYYGLDIGSYNSKAFFVNSVRFPEIGLNYHGKRLTRTLLALHQKLQSDDHHVDFGDDALHYMEDKPYMGAGFFPSYIGKTSKWTQKVAQSLYTNATLPDFEISDAMALFSSVYMNCIRGNKTADDIAIVVPASFTLVQREEIIEHFKRAGYQNAGTIDDVDAAIYTYGLTKPGKYTLAPRRVLFIDIGATSTKAYAVKFDMHLTSDRSSGKPFATRLSYEIDEESGGAHLTAAIAKHFGVDKLSSSADKYRVFNAAENLKKLLTIQPEGSVVFETMDGKEINISLTRSELETIAQPIIERIIATVKKAAQGTKATDIEFIGGSSRVLCIQRAIKAAFSELMVGKSLNADETLATGAAYWMQFVHGISPYSRLAIYNNYSIHSIKVDGALVCEKGKICQSNMTLDKNSATIKYTDLPPNVATNSVQVQWEGKNATLLFDSHPFSITDVLSDGTVTSFKLLLESPKGSDAYHSLSQGEASRQRIRETLDALDQLIRRSLKEIEKNQTVRYFSNHTQRLDVIRTAEEQKKWLSSGESALANETESKEHLKMLQRKIYPIYRRIEMNTTLYYKIGDLFQLIDRCKKAVKEDWKKREWTDEQKPHLYKLQMMIEKEEKWMISSMEAISKTDPSSFSPVKPTQVDQHIKALYDQYRLADVGMTAEQEEKEKKERDEFIKQMKTDIGKENPEEAEKMNIMTVGDYQKKVEKMKKLEGIENNDL